MNWMKKLGIAAAATCLLAMPAWAAEDLAVTDVTGTVENGSVSYSATVTNNTAEDANPIMVLVWYENGIMKGASYAKADTAIGVNGAATLTAKLTGVTVTDATRITGFIWQTGTIGSDGLYTIPVSMEEIEKLGSGNTKISSIALAGVDADAVSVDAENKVITVEFPLFDTDGNSVTVPEGALDATVNMEDAKASVKLDGTAFTGTTADNAKTGSVNLATSKEFTVTAEDGTVDTYQVAVARSLKLDFEDGGLVTGYSHGTDGTQTLTGNFAVKGNAAEYISGLIGTFKDNSATLCASGLSIGTQPVADALQSDGETLIDNSDYTAADGKAILVKKNTFMTPSGKLESVNTGNVWLKISALPGQASATEYVMEFDMAVDYNCEKDATKNLRTEFGHSGVNISGPSFRLGAAGVAFKTTAATKLNVGLSSGTVYGATTKDGSQWRHFKIDAAKVNGTPTYTFYIDGELITTQTNDSWLTDVNFQTSAQRATGLWFDNISISYK